MVSCPTCGEDAESSSTTLDDGRRPTKCLSCGEEWVRDAAWEFLPPREPQVVIPATSFDLQSVTKRVLARAQRFSDRDDKLAWDDLVRNNFLGVIGEDAVEIYLRACGFVVESWEPDPLFQTPEF